MPSVMFPEKNKSPKFSQIYVYDIKNELDNRVLDAREKKYDDKINSDTVKVIQEELYYVHKIQKLKKNSYKKRKAFNSRSGS